MALEPVTPERFTDCDVPIVHAGSAELFIPRGFTIDPIKFGQQQIVETLQVEIDDLDNRFTAAFVDETPQGATIKLYLVVLDANFQIVGDRVLLFEGELDNWSLEEGKLSYTVTSALVAWSQRTLSRHGKSCRWKVFKGTECSYAGAVDHCDRTYVTCEVLANTDNFGGFRWLPGIMNKEIWWGRVKGEEIT